MGNGAKADEGLADEVVAWIEERCHGRVTNVERQARWRPHHFVTVVDDRGVERAYLARGERQVAADSAFRAHFSIAHEARVLEALQGRGLKVPELFGFHPDHEVILMERLAGTNDLAAASSDDARRNVMYEYIEQLALLHRIPVESMALQGIDVPATDEDIAFAGKFHFMETEYDHRRPELRPEPLLELGLWWLHANVPRGRTRVSFLQGDTGPGQFMFADDRLTGLIDWELAHVGDPMLDLGVARMRNMLYPTGPLREPYDHYAEVTGEPIDWHALSFYTVFSMLLTPMGVANSIQRPSARTEGMVPRFGWDTTLRRGLCDALAEAVGIEIEPLELPDDPAGDPTMTDLLAEQLELVIAPMASTPTQEYEMRSAIAIARTLQREERIGAALLEDDLDDMGAVLGRRPRDRAEGDQLLCQLVDEQAESMLPELVTMFARIEQRKEHRLRPLMIAQSSAAFERLAPRDDRSRAS